MGMWGIVEGILGGVEEGFGPQPLYGLRIFVAVSGIRVQDSRI